MRLEWDSAHFGMLVAQAESLEEARFDEKHNDLVWLQLPTADAGQARSAEYYGYRFQDVRVTLTAYTSMCATPLVAECTESHAPSLVELARKSHRNTRFYSDGLLDVALCDDLYEKWIRKCLEGPDSAVLAVMAEGVLSGYVAVTVEGKEATLGLIAVDEASRRSGEGILLVRAALSWANKRRAAVMRVVTQGNNIAAQRLFQAAGFRTESTALWFSKWTENSG